MISVLLEFGFMILFWIRLLVGWGFVLNWVCYWKMIVVIL